MDHHSTDAITTASSILEGHSADDHAGQAGNETLRPKKTYKDWDSPRKRQRQRMSRDKNGVECSSSPMHQHVSASMSRLIQQRKINK